MCKLAGFAKDYTRREESGRRSRINPCLRPSKNHVKDTRKASKTVKDVSVSALRDRPNSPKNNFILLKATSMVLRLLEEMFHRADPYKARQYTCSSLVLTFDVGWIQLSFIPVC